MVSKLMPAVFLDRDGVVNEEVGYITSFNQLNIYPFAREAIDRLKSNGWKCIIVSNQSAVARGIITEDELQLLNSYIYEKLNVDGIYYCPHYPPIKEEIPPYNIYCHCRKPNIGMIMKAAAEHHLDLTKSYIVGDRASDIQAGINVGLKTVLVCTGYGPQRLEKDVRPDYIFDDLQKFVDFLLS